MATTELMVLHEGGPGPNGQLQFLIKREDRWCSLGKQNLADVQVEQAYAYTKLKTVTTAAYKPAAPAPAASTFSQIEFVGAKLFQNVLPDKVRAELATCQDEALESGGVPRLCIYSAETAEWIPWELLRQEAGQECFGLCFEIARMPFLKKDVPGSCRPEPHEARCVYNLLAKNTLDSNSQTVWEATFSSIKNSQEWEHRFPETRAAGDEKYWALEQMLEFAQPDILHFTCHGQVGKDGPEWLIDPKPLSGPTTFFPSSSVELLPKKTATRRPLVFGNACGSISKAPDVVEVAGQGSALLGANSKMATSFGRGFLARGALAYIGTFAQVSELGAAQFACQFYKELLCSGKGVASALLATKRHFGSGGTNMAATDPTWLFYCLYGMPDASFVMP